MRYLNKLIVMVIFVCLTLATFPQMARGATITVTNNPDSGATDPYNRSSLEIYY